MSELVFEVTQESDGGFCAECLTLDIFTQGDTWEELRANVSESVRLYFFDQTRPASIRLRLVRDEVFSTPALSDEKALQLRRAQPSPMLAEPIR